MAKLVHRVQPAFAEQSYVVEAMKGVAVVTRQFARNLFARKDIVTVQYPEERRPYAERFRGKHRLMKRDDGHGAGGNESVRCVACMLCATACPANCITIDAAEHQDGDIEKYPTKFEVDLLLCIYCGFCEEACPCDAIRLDTGVHTVPTVTRRDQKAGKIDLLKLGAPSIATQGGTFRAESHDSALDHPHGSH
jgi:NADH-quinone oxidoreductase subunit I